MKRTILLSFSLIFFVGISNAQFGGLVRKAQRQAEKSLNKKLEKEVEKKVEKEIDKAFDNAEKELADSTTQEQAEQSEANYEQRLGGLMQSLGVGVDVPHKEHYQFDAKMEMLIEHTNEDGKKDKPVKYHSFFNTDVPDYAIEFLNEEGQNSHFIFDFENKCSLILSDSGDDKTGIASNIRAEDIHNWVDESEETQVDYENYKKTGRKKTISGFRCEEHLSENEEGSAILWITQDLKNKINKSVYKNSVFGGLMMQGGRTDGVLIQYDYKAKSNNEKTLMTVTSIDFKSSHNISTVPYKIMGINVPK